uniref:EF-hand domain-containing protein n=1 Tax=Globodera rostochiensis TaxID=31243 RepID=A0A914HPF9_GLORO
MFFENFIFVVIKLLFLVKIGHVSSCEKTVFYNGCCNNFPLFACPKPFEPPNCNFIDHNCVACNYIYNKTNACSERSIGNSSPSMLEAEAKAWEHFDMIDVDKNGSISLNEAIDHLETKLKNGTSGKNLAKKVSWFAEMDSNGNNQIEPGDVHSKCPVDVVFLPRSRGHLGQSKNDDLRK